MFNKEYNLITLSQLFLEEAQQEVNSEAPSDDQGDDQGAQGAQLSQDQVMQMAQALQSGQMSEDDLQKALKSGQISEDDIQAIQAAMQGGGDGQSPDSPDEMEQMFSQEIDQVSDNFVRLNLYDKINDLIEKVDVFSDTYNTTSDGLLDRLKQVKNYLNILGSLIFNLDTNLVYQLYITLEMKAIDILRDGAGLGPDPELAQIFDGLKDQAKLNEQRSENNPTEIVDKLISGEMTLDDLNDLVKQKIYSQGEADKMIEQAKQGGMTTIDDNEAQEIANKIQSGEMSNEDLSQFVDSGKMSFADIDKIKQYLQTNDQNNNMVDQQMQDQQPEDQMAQPEQQMQDQQPEDQMAQPEQQMQDQQSEDQMAQPEQQMQDQQPEDQMAQPQPTQDQAQGIQVLDIAKAILSGESSADNLIQMLYNDQISKEDFKKITNIIGDLKSNKGDN